MTEQEKEKTFLQKNKEKIKIGTNIIISLLALVAIVLSIFMQLIDPTFALLSLPISFQIFLSLIIRIAPSDVKTLIKLVHEQLKNENNEVVNNFVDEIITNYSVINTDRNIEDPQPQITITEPEPRREPTHNAYFNDATGEYVITPRIPY